MSAMDAETWPRLPRRSPRCAFICDSRANVECLLSAFADVIYAEVQR